MDTHHVTPRTDRSGPGARPDVEVAALDLSGTVVSVNEAWERFALENGGDPSRTGIGTSFLGVCDAAGDDPVAVLAASAVRAALAGQLPAPLSMVIPCHAPHDRRWFDMLVTPRLSKDRRPEGATLELWCRGPVGDDPGSTAVLGQADLAGVVQDHLSISVELHARVVGRLFALAMDVHALATQVGDELTRCRLMEVVEGVDDAIVALRRTVFDLTEAPVADLALRGCLSQALDLAAAGSDLETTLAVPGGIDLSLSDRDVVDVVSVVREGVDRAQRAAAGTVAVRVGVDRSAIVVEVSHDWSHDEVGLGTTTPTSQRWAGRVRDEPGAEGQGRWTSWVVRLEPEGPAAPP